VAQDEVAVGCSQEQSGHDEQEELKPTVEEHSEAGKPTECLDVEAGAETNPRQGQAKEPVWRSPEEHPLSSPGTSPGGELSALEYIQRHHHHLGDSGSYDGNYEDEPCPCDFLIIRSSKEDQSTLTNRWYCWPRYIGGSILLCGRKRSRFPMQCFVGPDWPCMLVTYSCIIAPSVPFLLFTAFPMHPAVGVIGAVTLLSTLTAFSTTACSDPGIVYRLIDEECMEPRDRQVPRDRPCSVCEMQRPSNARHCHDCGVCIEELDHHCPWTGKCIGRRTLRFFYLFLVCLSVHIAFVSIVFFTDLLFLDDGLSQGKK